MNHSVARSTEISVVLPAYNEASVLTRTIDGIHGALGTLEVTYEIIVVDDGSTDGTFDQVKQLNDSRKEVKGLRLSRKFGKESALLAGLKAASGAVVVTMDADLQHPPELIETMLREWREGAKVVHAVKQGRQCDAWLNRARAALFNRVLSATSGLDMRGASDFKLLDRAVVDIIVNHLPERGRFYRGLAGWTGFEQRYVKFDVAQRDDGTGKWSGIALVDLAMTAVTSFTSAPLRIITILGVVTLAVGLVLSIEALWSLFRGYAVSGFVTILMTTLLIGSFIMISLGMIGEYIAKIYDEVKNRPSYLVESSCGLQSDGGPESADPGSTPNDFRHRRSRGDVRD